MTSSPGALPMLSLRGLRGAVLEGDPGCLCDPELFTGPAGIEAEDERRAQPWLSEDPPASFDASCWAI